MAYEFYKKFEQIATKKNKGKNKCNILVLHHSAGPTFKSFYNTRKNVKNVGSYQFVIDELGRAYKFGEPDDCCHHAGDSGWGENHPNKDGKSLNNISIGICVIGPLENGKFTDLQRQQAVKLMQYLADMYNIGKENIVRHIDITQRDEEQIKNKRYWNGKGLCRKSDISPFAWNWKQFLQEIKR